MMMKRTELTEKTEKMKGTIDDDTVLDALKTGREEAVDEVLGWLKGINLDEYVELSVITQPFSSRQGNCGYAIEFTDKFFEDLKQVMT